MGPCHCGGNVANIDDGVAKNPGVQGVPPAAAQAVERDDTGAAAAATPSPGAADPAGPVVQADPVLDSLGQTPPTPRLKVEPAAAGTLVQVAFPTQGSAVLVGAVVLGLILVAAGLLAKTMAQNLDVQSNVCLAAGIGLILAAFGGQANVKFGGIVLVGVAGIVGFLLWWLADQDRLKFDREVAIFSRDSFVSGRIALDPHQFGIIPEKKFYISEGNNYFDFAVRLADVKKGFTSLAITRVSKALPSCEQPAEDCQVPFVIPSALFLAAEKEPIYWSFQESKMAFYDGANQRVFGLDIPLVEPLQTGEASLPSFFSMAAYAQEVTADAPVEAVVDPALAVALAQLQSEDADERRRARSDLANGPVQWAKPIADELLKDEDIYRVQLGTLVALAEMLREKKESAQSVRAALDTTHLQALVAASANSDRTVRIYAGEFLYDLADPRTLLPTLNLANTVTDANIKYSLLFVASSAIQSADGDTKQQALSLLEQIKPGAGTESQQLIAATIKAAGQ